MYHTLLVTFAGTEMNILHVYTLLVIDCPSLFGIIHHIGVVVFSAAKPKVLFYKAISLYAITVHVV